MSIRQQQILTGVAIGLAGPLLGMLGYYLLKFFPTYSFSQFMQVLMLQKTLITGLSTMSLFTNVALLTIFLNIKRDNIAKGIFAVSCLYALAALIVKFFF